MKQTRLSILLISGRSDMGGGPRHMLDLLKKTIELYPHFNLFTASPDDPPFAHRFEKYSQSHLFIPSRTFSFIIFIKLIFFCKKNHITIIHSHGKAAGIYSRLLALFNINVIHTFHGIHGQSSIVQKAKNYLEKILAPLTQTFICVSKSEKETVESLGILQGHKIVTIENAIDLDIIHQATASNLKQRYQLPENIKLWGCLTRLSPEKGNDLLIKTLAQVESAGDYFIIAGSGPQKKELEEMAKALNVNNILFIGEIDEPISFLKGLDGYVSFSKGEGLPYSLLEALACELPCVLSRVKGHIDFQKEVRLFDLSDPQSFRDALNKPLQDKKLVQQRSLDDMVHAIVKTYI
jgi:glycosyltransferase involved in cell wall biosynthesis